MADRYCALRMFVLGAGALYFMLTPPAWTQGTAISQNSDAEERPGAASLSEILVTAQRRSESLKDVPISVQAVTSDDIAKRAVVSTQDLATLLPTVNFSTGNSANATSFSLRGVSSVAFQNGIQPSTAMVLDGVAVAKQGEFVSDLVDIDRVEVLNGPQGTLFGKNSTAGVINIVTKQPSRDFEARLDSLATTDEEYSVRPMLNVPLSDRVRLRVSGFYRDQHPEGRNLAGPDFLGSKSWGVDGKLAVDLSDDAQFMLEAAHTHLNSSLGQFTLIGPSIFAAQQTALVTPAGIGYGKDVVNSDTPSIDIVDTSRFTGTLNWNLSDELKLVSITNYSRSSERSIIDTDGTPTGANLGTGDDLPASTYPFKSINVGIDNRFPIRYHYISEEARVNYVSGPVNAVAGLYYQNYRDYYKLALPINFDGSLLGLTPGDRYYQLQTPQARVGDTTASVFGDVTYAVTEQFKPFAGVRYTREKLDVDYHRDDFLAPYSAYNSATGVLAAAPYFSFSTQASNQISNVSGRAGLQYLPTSDLNFYFSFARGYKAPAAAVSQGLNPGENPILRPEIAIAYELGTKLRLLNNRVALNLAVFHEQIKDIQEAVQPANTTVITQTLENAGTLTSKGVEAELQAAVTSALKFDAGVAYVDATYQGFAVSCAPAQLSSGSCNNTPLPGLESTNGQQAVGSPKWKYSLTSDYEDDIPGQNLTYFALISMTWTSSIQYALGDDPLAREPSHGMLNANFGLKGPKDRWEVQLFGKNLTNQFYYSSRLDIPVIGTPLGWLSRDYKRYGGVNVTFRY
jgi:iron complex outermembrane receptor protein